MQWCVILNLAHITHMLYFSVVDFQKIKIARKVKKVPKVFFACKQYRSFSRVSQAVAVVFATSRK